MPVEITDGMHILFQGDSITDAGRGESPNGLGHGYVSVAAMALQALYPERKLTTTNRGISGNRVKDLVARCNDCWRRYDAGDPTPVEKFEENYRDILTQVRDRLGAKIVIVEPFVLPHPPDRVKWREDLDPKIDAARRLAREFAEVYVPLDGVFASKLATTDPAYWAGDGVHPTLAGHGLIALEWVKAVTGREL
ncbi:MAG: SGNH/GDSL hydrolase family protein [Planctomycetota bacterium]